MADFISIDASELEDFGQQIGASAELIRTVSARFVTKVGDDTVAFAKQQPGPPRGFKMQFKSEKQRRFFFSALRSGAIQVPYQRRGFLSRGYLVRLVLGSDTFSAQVYNDTPYRRWVQGYSGEQARIHRGRWSNQEQIEAAAAQAVVKRLEEASNELMNLFLTRLGK